MNKTIVTIIIVCVVVVAVGTVVVYKKSPPNPQYRIKPSSPPQASFPPYMTLEKDIGKLNSVSGLSIDDFQQEVAVSSEASFGSAGEITGEVSSPDGKWIAISTHGAAHDFGWLYRPANKDTGLLKAVVFQYGGGVKVKKWSVDSRYITFEVTTPQPATQEKVVDTQNLPKYPL